MDTLEAPQTTARYPVGAFRQIGWAFLFPALTVGPVWRLGSESFLLDLLPDFIGYWMIATAAHRLMPLHRGAGFVRNLALVLAFLAIPLILQPHVTTAPGGNVTAGRVSFWPLTALTGLLELVLVWRLCGLVADVARWAGDERTAGQAHARRAVYLVLKVALTGNLVLLFALPGLVPLVAGVAGVLVVGLVLLCLMMGLMWRAERVLARAGELAPPPGEAGAAGRPGGWGFRVLAWVTLLLPFALAAGGVWYYREWAEARAEARESSSAPYVAVRDAFYADLEAGRLDEAYAATTEAFQARVSRAELADLAARYADYKRRPRDRRLGGGAGMNSGGDSMTSYEYGRFEKDKAIRVTVAVRRDPDSFFLRKPPPLKVDEFRVEETTVPEGPWPGFGRGGPGQ